jgi:hypothetical protein
VPDLRPLLSFHCLLPLRPLDQNEHKHTHFAVWIPKPQYPWSLGHMACHLKSLILETTACASVLTLVILTVERFRAICVASDSLRATQSSVSPAESIHMKRVAIRNILIIWIISIIAATPLTVYTQINYLVLDGKPLPGSAWCGMPFNAPNRVWQNFMVMSTVAFFIIPLIVITLLYSLIGRTLRRANRIPNPDFQLTDQCSSRKIIKSRTIVIRLLGNNLTLCLPPSIGSLSFLTSSSFGRETPNSFFFTLLTSPSVLVIESFFQAQFHCWSKPDTQSAMFERSFPSSPTSRLSGHCSVRISVSLSGSAITFPIIRRVNLVCIVEKGRTSA